MRVVADLVRRLLVLGLGGATLSAAVVVLWIALGLMPPVAWELLGGGVELMVAPSPADILPVVGVALLGVMLGFVLVGVAVAGLLRRRRVFKLNTHGPRMSKGRGTITVAERGLLNLLVRAADEVEEINGLEPSLSLGRKGWRVRCRVSVWKDTGMDGLITRLQSLMRDALEHTTGVQVDRIDLNFQHTPLQASSRRLR